MIKSLLDKPLITCVRVSKRNHYYHSPLELLGAAYEGWLDAVSKFKADKGVRFKTYAEFRIIGSILDYIRRVSWFGRNGLKRFMGEFEDDGGCTLATPATILNAKQESELLDRAMKALSPPSERIVRLYYYDGVTLSGIGKSMGFTEDWASKLRIRALRMLREEIGGMV